MSIVLLHGWGFSSRLWQPLIEALHRTGHHKVFTIDLPGFGSAFHEPCETLAQVLNTIVDQLPEKCVVGGWSLGGMLATQLAYRWPEKIAGFFTIGSNLHFTQDDDWPGMSPADFMQFCQRFSTQPEKTWQRFLHLQTRGDIHSEQHYQQLCALADYQDCHPHTARRMLDLLGNIDNRAIFSTLTTPGLHLFSENDAITPIATAARLPPNTSQRTVVISQGSHALPVSHADTLANILTEHFDNVIAAPIYSRKKNRIAHSFSQAAHTYNQAARLQQTVGHALLAAVPTALEGAAFDLGCGTGFVSEKLLQKSNSLSVVAVDLAHGMLQTTSATHNITAVQADMECLPFAANAGDYIFSSLALQWAENIATCFAEWRRVLKPTGTLFFTTFLPATLQELKTCWAAVDNDTHVNQFIPQDKLLDALRAARFTEIKAEVATHTLYYDQLNDLARELKAIGAHNMNAGRPQGLTGKYRWQQLLTAYESLRTERGLPATYDVLYVAAR